MVKYDNRFMGYYEDSGEFFGLEDEMKKLTSSYQNKLEFIKNPVIAEFL